MILNLWFMRWLFGFYFIGRLTLCKGQRFEGVGAQESLFRVDHPYNEQLFAQLKECDETQKGCDDQLYKMYALFAKIANEHSALLLNDRAQRLFEDVLYFLGGRAPKLSRKVCHILSTMYFADGNIKQADYYRECSSKKDMISLRSIAAHSIIRGLDSGLPLLQRYSDMVETHFLRLISTNQTLNISMSRLEMDEYVEEFVFSFLLSETQGGIRTTTKLVDVSLSLTNLKLFDDKFRFKLGLGLAKLGLHDLSVKQVGMAAVQWDSPQYYRLRAKLIFPPVHSSIGTLAAAVNNFERQMESILLHPIPRTVIMNHVCNSLTEAALALQALPLLHVIGFSSPRVSVALGHLPIPLPILLGEVYVHMCPLQTDTNYSIAIRERIKSLPMSVFSTSSASLGDIADEKADQDMPYTAPNHRNKHRKLHIGIVAGSFDGIPGRIMIGLLENFPEKLRKIARFTAMCFPTPRSAVTDRVNAIFDHHINLSPENKTQVMDRIKNSQVDFLLFADAAMDARVFALAHERFAVYQGILWSWGGTLGIPTIDYYFIPEIFMMHSRCSVLPGQQSLSLQQQRSAAQSKYTPQQHFREQIVFLEGVPDYPRVAALRDDEASVLLKTRYLLDIGNRTHIYLFPASLKHFHPEFDKAVEVIFRTDPLAVVVLAVPKTGRDHLPTTHQAVTHDLLHPAMPTAGVDKLKARVKNAIKANPDRVRVLPPLDEQIFRSLQQHSVAVLDPYPVGLHINMLEAILDAVPIVSAPSLQECTNSHTYSIAKYLNIMQPTSSAPELQERDFFPSTPQEYGVLAVRVAKESSLRRRFLRRAETDTLLDVSQMKGRVSHLEQIVHFVQNLLHSHMMDD